MNLLIRLSPILALAGASLSARASMFADDFSLDQAGVINDTDFESEHPSDIAFDSNTTRSLSTENDFNGQPGFSASKISVHGGSLVFSSDQDVIGFGDTIYGFASPVSFAETAAIDFLVQSNDVQGSLIVGLVDTMGRVSPSIIDLPPVTTPTHFLVPLVASNGIDLARITTFALFVGGSAGEDLAIDSARALPVPEPAPLLALGLSTLALLRRRKA